MNNDDEPRPKGIDKYTWETLSPAAKRALERPKSGWPHIRSGPVIPLVHIEAVMIGGETYSYDDAAKIRDVLQAVLPKADGRMNFGGKEFEEIVVKRDFDRLWEKYKALEQKGVGLILDRERYRRVAVWFSWIILAILFLIVVRWVW